jgi:hypothetical protein
MWSPGKATLEGRPGTYLTIEVEDVYRALAACIGVSNSNHRLGSSSSPVITITALPPHKSGEAY